MCCGLFNQWSVVRYFRCHWVIGYRNKDLYINITESLSDYSLKMNSSKWNCWVKSHHLF